MQQIGRCAGSTAPANPDGFLQPLFYIELFPHVAKLILYYVILRQTVFLLIYIAMKLKNMV